NAPPMPSARAPTPIFKNWPSKVPTFSKIAAACDWLAPNRRPARTHPHDRLTFAPPRRRTEARPRPPHDPELALRRPAAAVHAEQVNATHHVLPVSRHQVPRRLAVVRSFPLQVSVDLHVGRANHLHQVAAHGVDPELRPVLRQVEEIHVRAG